MRARFYAPAASTSGDVVTLPDDEAAHLARVLRLKRGDPVIVFNGQGLEFDATVERVGKDAAALAVGPARQAAPEARVAITLVQAVLKGDKMDDVVRDAVMIGVAAIQPIVAARSEMTLASVARGRKRERWQRIAVSAAKQCGRAVVPLILEPEPIAAVRHLLEERRLPDPALMLVEPRSGAEISALRDLDARPPREASLLIGPEGGWTPQETAGMAERCVQVTLGGRTIRSDAMALVAVAALYAKWAEF